MSCGPIRGTPTARRTGSGARLGPHSASGIDSSARTPSRQMMTDRRHADQTLIRPALESDLEALSALSHRTISASYRPFLGDEAVDAFLGCGAADQFIAESIGRCSVLVRDGEIVGYAVGRDNVIELMMIDYAAHRQGLGTQLLRHVEQLLFRSSD